LTRLGFHKRRSLDVDATISAGEKNK
jgi:hypothetical protein